jgi:hypothetical protein
VLIDVRATGRLRGTHPVDLGGCLGPVVAALAGEQVDLNRLRLVCDWIQYRHNFRDVLDCRALLRDPPPPLGGAGGADGSTVDGLELALDLRRCPDAELTRAVHDALLTHTAPQASGRLALEPWTAGRAGLIWQFNTVYWQHLTQWENATGRAYEQALPGGESEARDRDAAADLVADLMRVFDDLDARDALPEELYVVELGVGNGAQARTWLDEFAAQDRARGRDYYRRLRYLMGDYSPDVLAQARRAVADHAGHVSALALDATEPLTTLGRLRGEVFLVYISNVYDNLPTDEVARIGGRVYRVETRGYLSAVDVEPIAAALGTTPGRLPGLVDTLLKLGPVQLAEAVPECFPGVEAAVGFWRTVWRSLRLAERYVPLAAPDPHQIAPSVDGEALRLVMDAAGTDAGGRDAAGMDAAGMDAGGDVRMHVSNGALASFADALPLLHPSGRLHCHDLFVTDTDQYRTGFRGPGKYDGSVVNWVNGPLLRQVARRGGFEVSFAASTRRPGTHITTMTARPVVTRRTIRAGAS